jgi:hypothetical protein
METDCCLSGLTSCLSGTLGFFQKNLKKIENILGWQKKKGRRGPGKGGAGLAGEGGLT